MKKHAARFIVPLFIAILTVSATGNKAISYQSAFYAALATEDLPKIEAALASLKTMQVKEKEAYMGTLTMKKAGMMGSIKQKLNTFKEGHALLEGAIAKEPQNAEYSFLRLVIQENAPGILKYNNNIKGDALRVKQFFKLFDPVIQKAIVDYSKTSKALKTEELK